MSTYKIAFDAPGVSSEHYSIQRRLATMFPDTEIRRRYQEGAFVERPYALVSMVNTSLPSHNTYAGFAITDYVIAYYADTFEKAQAALDKFTRLQGIDNRIDLYDYSNPQSPTATDYKLRVQQATCNLISDLDDDTLYNVTCNLTVEGKRSFSTYEGTVVSSLEIGV